jgi:hypothetical protein
MSDPLNRSPIASPAYVREFGLVDRVADLLRYGVATGRLEEEEADLVLRDTVRRAGRAPVGCPYCGGGPMLPIGRSGGEAGECFECGRIHQAEVVPLDRENQRLRSKSVTEWSNEASDVSREAEAR